jgi:hypothetical protein
MWTRVPALAVAAMVGSAVVAGGCLAHPVGPARSFSAYEGKAMTTAEAARSAVATVQLVSDASTDGGTFGPYTAVTISEQEDGLSAVQGTFASIQPPDTDADRLRSELDAILASALDHVSQVRIAARRGELADLDQVASPLAGDIEALDAFVEDHG